MEYVLCSMSPFIFLSWRKKVYSWCMVVYSMYGFQIGFPFLSVIFFQLLKLYILYTTIHQNKLQYLCILQTKKSLVYSSKSRQKTIHQLYTNCSLNISLFVSLQKESFFGCQWLGWRRMFLSSVILYRRMQDKGLFDFFLEGNSLGIWMKMKKTMF